MLGAPLPRDMTTFERPSPGTFRTIMRSKDLTEAHASGDGKARRNGQGRRNTGTCVFRKNQPEF